MTATPLFPTEGEHVPPTRCPRCGGHVLRPSFTFAECQECGWTWTRDAQIGSDEPWPGEPL